MLTCRMPNRLSQPHAVLSCLSLLYLSLSLLANQNVSYTYKLTLSLKNPHLCILSHLCQRCIPSLTYTTTTTLTAALPALNKHVLPSTKSSPRTTPSPSPTPCC